MDEDLPTGRARRNRFDLLDDDEYEDGTNAPFDETPDVRSTTVPSRPARTQTDHSVERFGTMIGLTSDGWHYMRMHYGWDNLSVLGQNFQDPDNINDATTATTIEGFGFHSHEPAIIRRLVAWVQDHDSDTVPIGDALAQMTPSVWQRWMDQTPAPPPTQQNRSQPTTPRPRQSVTPADVPPSHRFFAAAQSLATTWQDRAGPAKSRPPTGLASTTPLPSRPPTQVRGTPWHPGPQPEPRHGPDPSQVRRNMSQGIDSERTTMPRHGPDPTPPRREVPRHTNTGRTPMPGHGPDSTAVPNSKQRHAGGPYQPDLDRHGTTWHGSTPTDGQSPGQWTPQQRYNPRSPPPTTDSTRRPIMADRGTLIQRKVQADTIVKFDGNIDKFEKFKNQFRIQLGF